MRHPEKMEMTFLVSLFILFLSTNEASSISKDFSSISTLSSGGPGGMGVSREPIKIKLLAPNTVSKKHTRTRQNSRFLRTFPPMELLNLARVGSFNDVDDDDYYTNYNYNYNNNYNYRNHHHHQQWPMKSHRIDAGNSPIFYIKLPPVPYVFMPGVGYVSPHPYGHNNGPAMPMSFSAGSGMLPPFLSSSSPLGSLSGDSSSSQENSVISLPLKFLSNGRPHQIESPKRKRRPGLGIKDNTSSAEKPGASLISGGKYSFNGRPTAVFVVRSPNIAD